MTSSTSVYQGKEGTVWTLDAGEEELVGRISQHNILKDIPGPTSFAKRNITESDNISALNLFIDSYIIDHIVKCTEIEARLKLNCQDWKTSREEIYQLIAIMYARGLLAKGHPVDQIWSKTWGIKFFSDTMSRNRYKQLLRFIRFDIRSTRSERLATDKFALFSTIWNRFIENCKSNYVPNANITIDEQLFPTKARCPFTQYMANKPDKFGVKFWLAVDASSKYLLNGFPYLGKDARRPSNQPISEYIVLQLMDPYLGKGRNVTTDNFFTSVKLAEKLEKKKTSIVGTMNRIRREIPQEIKTMKAPLHSTKILRNNNMTLTVYQGKTNKNVLLLSTVHRTVKISEEGKKLPESVKYYNETKYGVDVIDQMARIYSTKVSSRRWPLQMFYNVLDLAGINAYVVYKEVTGKKISRREFLLKLIQELQMKNSNEGAEETNDDTNAAETPSLKTKRQWCKINCTRQNRKLTNKKCATCKLFVCSSCIGIIRTEVICKKC